MKTKTQIALEAAVKNLQTYADEIDASSEPMSGEQMSELKNRMAEVKDLKNAVTEEADAKGALAEAKAFMSGLSGSSEDEKAPALPTFTASGMPMQTQGKTFGELFIESDGYKQFVSRFSNKDGIIPNGVKGVQSNPFSGPDLKALITGGSATSAGALVTPDRYAPITDLVGERELTIADLVTKGTTESDAIEYVRVTGKTNNAAPVAEATSAAGHTVVDGVLTPAAGGGYKPESGMSLEVVKTAVKTIAHWIPITKRAASDASQVRTMVDNFLRYGLNEALEDQILNGNGVGENFDGIMGEVTQTVGSAGTDLDAIVDAIRTVRVAGRRKPNAVVMHPNDWFSEGFLLAKNANGNYLVGDPRASVEQLNQLWGLQVVVSEAMTENTALVGDFRQSVLWEREGVSLLVSDQHSDFFTRNLLAILAEFRAGFGVLDPAAWCKVTTV